jgi:hypothetical protein
MSRGSGSPLELGPMLGLELSGQAQSGEATAEACPVADRLQADGVAVDGELHLVPGEDAKPVAQRLWDHDLALRANAVSHTCQYNPRGLLA